MISTIVFNSTKIPKQVMEFTKHTMTTFGRLVFRAKAKGSMNLHTQSIAMQKEIGKQSETSFPWWESHYLLTRLNKVRIPFIQNGIHEVGLLRRQTGTVNKTRLEGVKILEVGCGGGIICEELARLGADVIGLDIDSKAINEARKHQLLDNSIKDNLKYINDTIYEHERENSEKYDAVVLSEVIEHIRNEEKEKILSSSINTLQPGGSLFITTPNKTISSLIIVIFLAEMFNIIPKGTHLYDEFIAPEDLIKMIEKNKCEIKTVDGIYYNPFRKEFVNSRRWSLYYGIHALKINEKSQPVKYDHIGQ
ncbi:ubiquinone biosynthesis O-methyltransferase-like [Planococcus citri]|uniref:ubiquinone biosynthesis O-methyltransferase-like n=1 Tax=Planococcus citri TaxID=170843 RepID=UPI0031F8648C